MTGEIERGLLVLLGVGRDDTAADVQLHRRARSATCASSRAPTASRWTARCRRRRRRPGRLAVHALRRRPQGPAAVVRRGGARPSRRARLYEDFVRELRAARTARRDRRVPGDDAGGARQRRPGHHPRRQPPNSSEVVATPSPMSRTVVAARRPRRACPLPPPRSSGRSSPRIPRRSAPAACCSRPASTTRRGVEYPVSGLERTAAARAARRRQRRHQLDRGAAVRRRLLQPPGDHRAAVRAPLSDMVDRDRRLDVERRGPRRRHEGPRAAREAGRARRSASASPPSCRTPRTRAASVSTRPTSPRRC